VFLSYASQDAEAARRICEALRAAGIEVWFDQSALRGGEVWDQTIRKQIKTCALFVPVISRHTHDRVEGYFRLEWKLAVDRSHLIASDQTFLLPVVIDNTREDDERVPDKFREVHWTHLPQGEAPPGFVERVQRLLSPQPTAASASNCPATAISGATTAARAPPRWNAALLGISAVAVVGLGWLAADRLLRSKHAPPAPASASVPADHSGASSTAVFNPPPHSIAVLPFVNMSGDPNQQYFSDGLTEELLNSLSRINELQVAARTSSFSFQGEHPDLATVAHKLNVASVLEGSVRRSGHTIRVTAQLNNATTGFHIWSQTYDRDLGDILSLQTEIATAVAGALKVTLLGDAAAKIESGGTRNPAALDAYLRATDRWFHETGPHDQSVAIEAYSEAIHADPNYALALANRSIALSSHAGWITGQAMRGEFDKAQADARRATALAPELAEARLALAYLSENSLDFAPAAREYEHALGLAPGNARVLRHYGTFAVRMGRTDAGIAAVRQAVVLDPLNPWVRLDLGYALMDARRYDEALTAFQDAITLDPASTWGHAWRGIVYYVLGDLQKARSSCEAKPDFMVSQLCLALVYEKLGRHADSQAMLAKVQAENGDAQAYAYAAVYSTLGSTGEALEWLETAYRVRDPGLVNLKVDAAFDALRSEPRFQTIERELKFPN
jgi:TolB-like protein/Flp pilus assembly protein TadD